MEQEGVLGQVIHRSLHVEVLFTLPNMVEAPLGYSYILFIVCVYTIPGTIMVILAICSSFAGSSMVFKQVTVVPL